MIDSTSSDIIHVIDYGICNIASVVNMIRKLGFMVRASSNFADIQTAGKLILPGVGSFDKGISRLHELDLFNAIVESSNNGTPILGICLGMQLLAKNSEEGNSDGLSLIDATCKRFEFGPEINLPIPHVGWNVVSFKNTDSKLYSVPIDPYQRFYFTHSYHLDCQNEKDVVGVTNYGYDFPSIISSKNVYGAQFHPEKSHKYGMALLNQFANIKSDENI